MSDISGIFWNWFRDIRLIQSLECHNIGWELAELQVKLTEAVARERYELAFRSLTRMELLYGSLKHECPKRPYDLRAATDELYRRNNFFFGS